MQQLLAAKYIHGDKARLFLNTELGCASSCSYCYLPKEGFAINASAGQAPRTTAKEILEALTRDKRFLIGPQGTVISIGCFSECWDKRNRNETLALIIGLLPFGNPIQMATKRKISAEDLVAVIASPAWQRQLHIYISSASISEWATFETGTTAPNRRFESFSACRAAGVDAFLYIKPVLPNVTVNDVSVYGEVMSQNQVGAIVGDQFEEGGNGPISPISANLTVVSNSEVDILRERLAVYGKVYANSIDTLMRKESK